jgi:hypothetical protein
VSNTGAACLIGTVARLLSTRGEGHAELACKRSLASHRQAGHELRCIDPISREQESVGVGMSCVWHTWPCVSVVTVKMPFIL